MYLLIEKLFLFFSLTQLTHLVFSRVARLQRRLAIFFLYRRSTFLLFFLLSNDFVLFFFLLLLAFDGLIFGD